jgi:hypothetical protein
MGTLIALNVTFDELDFLGKRQEILASTGREVVEYADAVPLLDQARREMGPDEAPASGDECSHPNSASGMPTSIGVPTPFSATAILSTLR